MIRVRIAPSPTGHLHVGTARTALFNLLFAKHNGGKFILRIEDTDLARSKKEYEEEIIKGLQWLGFDWDEGPDKGGPYGPYRQTERKAIYKTYLQRLLDDNHAYYCTCTTEELEKKREESAKLGKAPIYDGACRAANRKNGPGVIRFKIPEEKITFEDIIRGKVTFDGALLGDIVIAKDIESPFYNIAVVIDDHEMKITHVIRGEEHLGNTPKQLFFHRALGVTPPTYAHLPLLLNKNRAKLSKRDATTVGIDEYERAGYLPEAIVNFIALLGWHPKDDQELLTRDELIAKFDLERAQKAGAIFDIEKLSWLNSAYIKMMDDEKLYLKLIEHDPNLKQTLCGLNEAQQIKLVRATKNRMKTLNDFAESIAGIVTVGEYDGALLIWKETPKNTVKKNLEDTKILLEKITIDHFAKKQLEATLKPLEDVRGRGEVLWPLRVALSGLERSPGPFEIMDIIGKEQSIERIDVAIAKLTT